MNGFYMFEGGVLKLLNERIIKLRKARNITQEELAKRIGTTRSALSQYETGTRQPDYDTLQRISKFFEVSTDYLLGAVDNPSPPTATKKTVYDLTADHIADVVKEVSEHYKVDISNPTKLKAIEDLVRMGIKIMAQSDDGK